jgi:hypothetical protein
LLLLWFGLKGNNLFLRFAILIITIYNGNNCFILLQATLVKIVWVVMRGRKSKIYRQCKVQKFEDTKGVIRSRESMKYRQCNGQKETRTLRLLVSCIYFKYSFNRSIEEYIYYAITIWPLYVVDIKSCHHEAHN